jgi:hypothetical protein
MTRYNKKIKCEIDKEYSREDKDVKCFNVPVFEILIYTINGQRKNYNLNLWFHQKSKAKKNSCNQIIPGSCFKRKKYKTEYKKSKLKIAVPLSKYYQEPRMKPIEQEPIF